MTPTFLIFGICAVVALAIFAPKSAFSVLSAAVIGLLAALLLRHRAFVTGATISVVIIVAATVTGLFHEAIFRDRAILLLITSEVWSLQVSSSTPSYVYSCFR